MRILIIWCKEAASDSGIMGSPEKFFESKSLYQSDSWLDPSTTLNASIVRCNRETWLGEELPKQRYQRDIQFDHLLFYLHRVVRDMTQISEHFGN